MRLFLASRAKNSKTIEKLKDYIGGFDNKKVVYIPTAANAENGWESWKNSETWKMLQKLVPSVTLLQLEDYRNKSAITKIASIKPDIIWFAGGMPGYLMYWIRRCSLDSYLPKILDQGTLFFGSSAGAMITGKSLQVATFGFVDNEKIAKDIKPLNLVDFDIFPHYQDNYLSKIKEKYKGGKLYLLKDGEEIIVEDGKIQVIGEERVITNK